MTADQRPSWRPFSESAADLPAQQERPRLLPVERSPFLEPAGSSDEQQWFAAEHDPFGSDLPEAAARRF
ncbi:hypothetical protein ACFVVX_10965 [Kitasatospora sp. NPDC058170]|uniref:hypothetical protein n=1 Tax=Kitasatospora sp. NPDC058170 TaxID=3346364 RepID=UPI0036DDA984